MPKRSATFSEVILKQNQHTVGMCPAACGPGPGHRALLATLGPCGCKQGRTGGPVHAMETGDDSGWSVGAQRGRQQCWLDPEKLVHQKDQPSRGADEGMGGDTNWFLLASFSYALRKAALRWGEEGPHGPLGRPPTGFLLTVTRAGPHPGNPEPQLGLPTWASGLTGFLGDGVTGCGGSQGTVPL